jgi:hypothetical protein
LPRLAIPLAAGVAEAEGDAGVGLVGDIAVAIVGDLVEQATRVIDNLTDTALVVSQHPAGLATSVFSEDLVYRWAIEVALFEGVVTVKDEGNVFTVIDVAFSADSPNSSPIGIDAFGDAAVEGIVRVIDLSGNGTPSGWSDNDAGEAVAVVPGGVGDFSRCDIRAAGAVAFVIVRVGIDPITEQTVVAAGLITCIGAVAVAVIGVGFIGLGGVIGAQKLTATIVAVGAAVAASLNLTYKLNYLAGLP